MESHTIAVSDRQMKRYELLSKVLEGKLTLAAVTFALGVSYRHAKRLKRRVAAGGLAALAHGNRGRPPSNQAQAQLRERVLTLSAQRYYDFNDTHFAEALAEHEDISLSRETVRCWRRAAGIAPKRRHRAPAHRRRRERKPAAGLMMLWDGSPHHWLGPEQPPCCLMAAMDDATSQVLGLVFVPRESSWAYLKLLAQVLERHGVPASVYQDRHTIHQRGDDFWTLEEELAGRQHPTQVGAALEALGIEPIFALSPQAKGRVERLFGTLQDRLVASLRLAGITDIAAANAYAQNGFMADFNQRFAVAPECAQGAWRKAPQRNLRRILALCYRASVGNDNTVRFAGMVIDIAPGPRGRSYAHRQVQLRQLLDGSWHVYYQDQLIATAPPTEIAELIRTRRRRKGVRAAADAHWVFRASAPGRPPAELASLTPSSLRVGPVRRAGPGQIIKGKRIA